MLTDRLRAWIVDPTPPQSLPTPAIDAPPLHDLRVAVPALPAERELTEAMLLDLYAPRLRALAPRRVREVGEMADAGDDVRVRMAFFGREGAVARTAADRLTLIAGEPWMLPGVGERLVGATPAELIDVPTRFPADWPVAALRGLAGFYRLRVLAIEQVTLPDPEAASPLEELGIDVDLPTFMGQLRQEYVDGLTAELRQQGQDAVFELLRQRSPIAVPNELVEREIFERWAHHEGSVLLDLDAGESDLNLSLAAWLRDGTVREEVRRSLHISMLLGAVARRDGVEFTPDDLEQRLHQVAARFGFDPDDVRRSMRDDSASGRRFVQDAYHLHLVDHVMAQATILYREPRD